MGRRVLVVLMLAVTLGVFTLSGCGSTGHKAPAGPSQAQIDRADTRAIEKQVDRQLDDRLQTLAAEENDIVDSDTSCVKRSATSYKCITSFVHPADTPTVVTDVTCDRSGVSCITETRP